MFFIGKKFSPKATMFTVIFLNKWVEYISLLPVGLQLLILSYVMTAQVYHLLVVA